VLHAGFFRGEKFSEIVVDHSIVLCPKDRDYLDQARAHCCPPPKRPDWTQAEDNNLLYIRDFLHIHDWRDVALELAKRQKKNDNQRNADECKDRHLDLSLRKARNIVMAEKKKELSDERFEAIMEKGRQKPLLKVFTGEYPKASPNRHLRQGISDSELASIARRYEEQDQINKSRPC
jgi:hypothetical protein